MVGERGWWRGVKWVKGIKQRKKSHREKPYDYLIAARKDVKKYKIYS